MKPPPSVEELREIMHGFVYDWVDGKNSAIGCARAILARVRESIPHLEVDRRGLWVVVTEHETQDGRNDCASGARGIRGNCFWEEPR